MTTGRGERVSTRAAGATPARLRSLDGLRGLAAVVVLIHHGLLTFPPFASVYYGGPSASLAAWEEAAAYTPLHLTWAGEEAVLVFFVLSGVVLAGPYARGVAVNWHEYYVRRLIRLYLPVLGAVMLGYGVVLLLPRPDASTKSAWLATRPSAPSVSDVVHDVTLVGGVSRVISPLWSLQWEVLFSLALPAFVLVGRYAARHRVAASIAMLLTATVGALAGVHALLFLSVFAIGAMVGADDRLLRPGPSRYASLRWTLVGAATALLLSSYWMLRPWIESDVLHAATRPVTILGAVLCVVLASRWNFAHLLLTTGAFQWLGRISFSLYLVHEPIVIAFATISEDRRVLGMLSSIAISVVFAWAFFHLVEAPSHRLAKRAGSRVERRGAAPEPPVTTT